MQFADDTILASSRHFFVQSSAMAREYMLRADSMGHFFVTAQYQVSRMNYDSYLLLTVVAGRLKCETRGQGSTLLPGSVLLLDCTQPHRYWALEDSEFLFLHINGSMMGQLYQGIHSSGLAVPGPGDDLIPQTILELLAAWASGHPLKETQVSARLYTMLMSLLDAARMGQVDEKELAAMEEVQCYIQQHLQERLTVEDLAERTGYSASHFNRLFRRAAGQSPYQFITRARMDRARHLLATSGLTIQEIADGCGFPSVSNFSHCFHQLSGMTPTEFRRQPI